MPFPRDPRKSTPTVSLGVSLGNTDERPERSRDATSAGLKSRRISARAFEVLRSRSVASATDVPDGNGLYLRLSPTGTHQWRYQYRLDGKLRWLALGSIKDIDTLSKARVAHAIARGVLKTGKDPALEKKIRRQAELTAREKQRAVQLFGDFAADYVAHGIMRKGKNKGQPLSPSYRVCLENDVLPRWKNIPLSEIDSGMVATLVDAKAKTAPVQANRLRSVLQSMFSWGLARGKFGTLQTNPVDATDRPTDEKRRRRKRILNSAEVGYIYARLLSYSAPMSRTIADILVLMMLTCQRSGDIRQMRWIDVNLNARAWKVSDATNKTGDGALIPLSEPALAIIAARIPLGGEFVFPSPTIAGRPVAIGSVDHAVRRWSAAHSLKRDGVDRPMHDSWLPHDLKHLAYTYLRRIAPADVVSLIASHALPGMAAIYDHNDYEPDMRKALDTLAARLGEIASGASQ